ncbi:MAG: Glu/Leu/Phe/Val family dehydrogenase [Solirubrobacteraceae bacterium]
MPAEARVVVQGYGNVGSWVARIMAQLGCTIVGASDSHGAIHAPDGLDPEALARFVSEGGKLPEFDGDGVEPITPDELLGLECEVLIPAALGGMLHRDNVEAVRAKVIIEGANGPTTPAADEILTDKGVHVIPDVMANAGGVIVSYFEWVQNLQHFRWDEREVNEKLGTIIRRAYREVSARAQEEDTSLRIAGYEIGIERVVEAATARGYIG